MNQHASCFHVTSWWAFPTRLNNLSSSKNWNHAPTPHFLVYVNISTKSPGSPGVIIYDQANQLYTLSFSVEILQIPYHTSRCIKFDSAPKKWVQNLMTPVAFCSFCFFSDPPSSRVAKIDTWIFGHWKFPPKKFRAP